MEVGTLYYDKEIICTLTTKEEDIIQKWKKDGVIIKIIDNIDDIEETVKLKVHVQTQGIAFLREAGITPEEEYSSSIVLFTQILQHGFIYAAVDLETNKIVGCVTGLSPVFEETHQYNLQNKAQETAYDFSNKLYQSFCKAAKVDLHKICYFGRGATDPSYQGKGIMSDLLKLAEFEAYKRDYQIVFGLASSLGMQKILKKLQYGVFQSYQFKYNERQLVTSELLGEEKSNVTGEDVIATMFKILQ